MRVCMLAEASVQGRIAMAVSIPPSRPRPGRPQHDHQVSTNESRPRKVCRQAQCSPGRRSSGACGVSCVITEKYIKHRSQSAAAAGASAEKSCGDEGTQILQREIDISAVFSQPVAWCK